MLWLALLNVVSATSFGIDLGSEYIKVSMAKPGKGIHVALNQQSKRLSPTYFAIWNISNPKETNPKGKHWTFKELEELNWAFLDSAKSHSLRFPQNMVKGVFPIQSSVKGFTKRETTALLLRHLISVIDESQWVPETSKLIFAVDPFLPISERVALMESVFIANSTIFSIIDAPTAAAEVYALERRSLYSTKPKKIMFIDIGASKTWASIFQFSNESDLLIAQELSISGNSSLGGNLIDSKLSEFLLQKFVEINKIEKPTNERFLLRFQEESRRIKEQLSLNHKVDIQLEDIIDEYGLQYQLTREEFDSLITEFNVSLTNLFNTAIHKANITINELDSIELIGGTTRIPYLQEILLNLSKMSKLNRTLNSDEVISIGAGYIGAILGREFVVRPVVIDSFINSNITIRHNNKTIQIFNESSRIYETYTYEYNSTENSPISLIADKKLLTINVNIPKNFTENVIVQLNISFNSCTIPYVSGVTLNGSINNDVNFVKDNWTMQLDEYKYGLKLIAVMDHIVKERENYQKINNDYESYIYKIKNNLNYDNVYKKVVNETERENILNIIDKNQKFLLKDRNNQQIPIKKLIYKFELFRNQTQKIVNRVNEYIKRAPAFNSLNITLNMLHNAITVNWPKLKPWIPKEKIDEVWSVYNNTKLWLNEKYNEQRKVPDTEDPIVLVSEINMKKLVLEYAYNSTNRIPKPMTKEENANKENNNNKKEEVNNEKKENNNKNENVNKENNNNKKEEVNNEKKENNNKNENVNKENNNENNNKKEEVNNEKKENNNKNENANKENNNDNENVNNEKKEENEKNEGKVATEDEL
ncbi:dnaK protein [Histomonas meleagridis]|uniref:dnaK protein n=1 Tax=Histomonas meleagridis TaxID=135588 RepID=UPI0035593F77|nr:dnaK protein [Histomonas meleagridis]KAH0802151.1 dnaK protein [Histomonas meleagridis]